MSETSEQSKQQTLPGFGNAISSAGLAAGDTLSNSRDGVGPCGLAVVLANRFRTLANAAVRTTNGTSGQNSTVLLASVALQQSLANKLIATTDLNGSMEYRLTWKKSNTPSGRCVSVLRAKGRRTQDTEYGGWPTPTALSSGDSNQPANNRSMNRTMELLGWATPTAHNSGVGGASNGNRGARCLQLESQLVGWPTTRSNDATGHQMPDRQGGMRLPEAAQLAGWNSPTATDNEGNGKRTDGRPKLPGQALLFINALTESSVGYRLNPAHSRWLMGFPATWDAASPNFDSWQSVQETIASDVYAVTVTPSSPS